MQLLASLVEKEPRNADVRLLLGSLLMERKQGPESIAQLTEAVRLRPWSAEAENTLGEAYSAFEKPKLARSAFAKAVLIDPNFGFAQLNLGKVLLQADDLPGANHHLERAAKLLGRKDDAADAHYFLAKVHSAQGKPTEAAQELEKAVTVRSAFSQAWSDLGEVRQLLQDDRGASEAYEHAVHADPNDSVAQYRLGSAYLRSGRAQDAIEPLKAAYRLNPEDQSTLNALQTALRKNGQAGEADAIKQRLTDLLKSRDQKNQDALAAVKLNNEGAALEKTGDFKSAAEKYRQALSLYPDHNGIRVNYAVALLRTGEWKEGLSQLQEASRRDPGNEQIERALRDAQSQAPAVDAAGKILECLSRSLAIITGTSRRGPSIQQNR